LSARSPPQAPLWELTALPHTPYLDFSGLLRSEQRGEEKGKGGKERVRKKKSGRRGREGRESVPLYLIFQFDHW